MDLRTKRVSFNELKNKESDEEILDGENDVNGDDRQEVDVVEDDEDDDVFDTSPSNNVKNEFTVWKEVLLSILIIFYVVDLALDIWVAVRCFTFKHPKNGWFVIFCILLPNLYAGYKSLQWYLIAHDLEPIRSPIPWIIRISFFPFSLLLRYYDTWRFGLNSRKAAKNHDRKAEVHLFSSFLIESAEVSTLRLFTIFLEDAPIAVLNLKDVILTAPDVQKHKMEMVSVVMFKLIFTMTFGVVHFLTSTKAVLHAAKTDQYFLMGAQWVQKPSKNEWQKRGFLSLKAEICIYFWHLCAIGSRLVVYAMFAAVYQNQLWILILIRWIINVIWIKTDAWEISLTNCIAFGGVYLFSFVPVSPKSQLLRILVYYFLTLVENVIIAVLFSLSDSMRHNEYGSGAYTFVFVGMALSMVFMCFYYGKLHPGRRSMKLFSLNKDKILNFGSANS